MPVRWFALLVITSSACGRAAPPPPIANAPTSPSSKPKQLDIVLADPGWQERYADAKVRAVDGQTFAIDTGTEQLTITTGAEAAQTFDQHRAQVLGAGMHVEQSTSDMNGAGSWQVVASRDGSSVGASRVVGADGAVLCRFQMRGTEGWTTPLGLCDYVLGIVAPR